MILGVGFWADHTGDSLLIYVPQCLGTQLVTQRSGGYNHWELAGNLPLRLHRTSWLAEVPS